MQGQLRKEKINFSIRTNCAHCGKEIQIEMGSDLQYTVSSPGAEPLIFIPMVDFKKLKDPSIIDVF